ncbi:aminotransferase class V-fold PLP-dependent enzyme [Actinomadura sp. 3N407]|uniref:aminotransferase class V-fold PLP-dependent enzyme n=1 Tax=Actinomadura sp. 3N407 TaxID=3457423 RepID=UPI003FCE5526
MLGGGLLGAGTLLASGTGYLNGAANAATGPGEEAGAPGRFDPRDWSSVRDQFAVTRRYAQFTAFVLSSPPAQVRAAVARYRRLMDFDPHKYGMEANDMRTSDAVRRALAAYAGGDKSEYMLTDSTTMGLGLLYRGLKLRPGQEVLTTDHEFYATHEALRLHSDVAGFSVRRVPLYTDPARASVAEIVARIRREIRPGTRVLALTSVHSSTGVRLPMADICEAVKQVNARRDAADRVLVCVDGAHEFAATLVRIPETGCDFYVTSGHKWLFGPRGTGFVWGRTDAWAAVQPIIPSFSEAAIVAWIEGRPPVGEPGELNTPGGYHTFENRWALPEALDFHRRIGAERIRDRIQELSTQLKDGLSELGHVRLHTPRDPALSAGIVCFSVEGMETGAAQEELIHKHRVYAGATPYKQSYVRLGPSLVTGEADVRRAVRAVAALR